ncbi:MAG: hypothetical protein RR212_10270 [Bacteroidales bacterium]
MEIEQKTKKILDEAMQDVIQELLINDEHDVPHLVYIHKVYWDNGLKVEFSTPEEDKEALIPLVHDAIYAQIAPTLPKPEKTLWAALKAKLYSFFQMFANLV